MGKRQIRIFRKDIVLKKTEIVGREGHVILTDHVVFNGKILEITDRQLILQDLRLNKHVLDLTQLVEVVYDKETVF
jgi:hypothetical protein